MTATDTIRAMLDERGVEHETEYDEDGWAFTRWHGFDDTGWLAASDEMSGLLDLRGRYLFTPEQAIEATLGRGTCQLKRANWDDGTCTWGCICSACDAHLEHETGIGYSFCPHCGAKVVRA